MSATAPTKPPIRRRPAVDQSAAWRPLDRIGLAFGWFLGLFACVLALAIIIYLLVQGVRYLRIDMLFESPLGGVSEKDTGGLKDPILGTVLVAGLATVIALPTGVLMGIRLSEFGKPTALARAVESAVEATAGVPSIVLALFGGHHLLAAVGRLREPRDGRGDHLREVVHRGRGRCSRSSPCR